MPATQPAPGCTCVHAAGLHRTGGDGKGTGCRVGWSGAGAPAPGALVGRADPSARSWPAGCRCTAAPVQLGHVVPPAFAAATEAT